jgi:hypothetical protein
LLSANDPVIKPAANGTNNITPASDNLFFRLS